MAEIFSTSGEKSENVVAPTPLLQGLFVPGIDNPLAVDGFGIVTPWGGGGTARKYTDYGISGDISRQTTQLGDLASSLIPVEGAGISYSFEGLVGPQGIPGQDGRDGIIHIMGLNQPFNSNFLSALPHNIDQINALGTAVDKLIYTDAYNTYTEIVLTERQPAGDVNKNWDKVASDDDGSHLVIGIEGGRLYTSDDSGVTWTERQPAGDANQQWECVASDSDGSHLIAGINGGRLYTSADSGVNWTERRPAGDSNQYWEGAASDSDGSHLIVGANGGRLYTSANYGVNWTERQPAGDATKWWYDVASDSDGSHLIAAVNGGRLYTSANYGVNWTERQPAGDADEWWDCVASDSDGSNLIVGFTGGRLYTSADSGVNWTERRPAGDVNKNWHGVASDGDGSHLIAIVSIGRIYISSDSGVTWTEEQPAGDVNKSWRGVAIDSDGSNYIVGARGGRLYTGVDTTLYSEATWAESSLTSAGRAILDDADAPAQATTLGLGTGDSPTWVGATLSGLTATRVLFAGTGGVISDDSGLVWDNVNKRLGINTTPSFPLDVVADTINVSNNGNVNLRFRSTYDGNTSITRFELGRYVSGSDYSLWTMDNRGKWDEPNDRFVIANWIPGSDFRQYFTILIDGKTGVGVTPVTRLTVEGALTLKEQASADADTEAYGQIWCKTATPNQLWFTDDAGTDLRIAPQDLQTTASPTFVKVNVTDEDNALQIDGDTVLRIGAAANNNLFVGCGAFNNDDGQFNIGIGYQAGYYNDTTGAGSQGDSNVYIGYRAGYGISGPTTKNTGYYNIGIGSSSLRDCQTGVYNVGLGFETMRSIIGGSYNVAIASQAGWNTSSGNYNFFMGRQAGFYNSTGSSNIYIGYKAGFGTSGQNQSFNIYIGDQVGQAQTSANFNTVVGIQSGFSITSGDRNIFLGYKAGYRQTTNSDLLIIDNQDRGSAANEAIQSLIYGKFDTAQLKINGAISSATLTFSTVGPTDNVDVSGINTLFLDTSNNTITIGGFANGVDGQVLYVVRTSNANNAIIEHNEAEATQKIFLHAGADETLGTEYGGWIFVCHGGTDWHDCSHAKHVP